MKLVHWPLMGGLLHLVQREGDWVGPQPAQAPPCCTKYNSPPINGQCTNEHLYSPRMVEEIKEEKRNGTSNKQTVIWPNYLNYLN